MWESKSDTDIKNTDIKTKKIITNLEKGYTWHKILPNKNIGMGNVCVQHWIDSVGEGEGGMIWENSTETCVLPYVK